MKHVLKVVKILKDVIRTFIQCELL